LADWSQYAFAEIHRDCGRDDLCREHLGRIPRPASDVEFNIRLDLLEARAGEVKPSEERFQEMEARCRHGNFLELLWELYHAWAGAEVSRERVGEAILLLEKGIDIIEEIAVKLPEEYRDRYLKQRQRRALFQDLKALSQCSSGS